jgi:putative sterol carrier protein
LSVPVLEELLRLAERMNADPEPIRSFDLVYQFNLSESGVYQVRFAAGTVTVAQGSPDTPACTLILTDENFGKLLRNDLNTTMAFMLGSLKVDGKVGLALKLQEALKHYV